MEFLPHNIYHVYNRGNEKQQLFFSDSNYIYFLEKLKKYIEPNCDILAWCLMPNHFHFLIHANEKSNLIVTEKPFPIFQLVNGFRLLLSSYTKGINIQQNRTGNLFQQKTKSKSVMGTEYNYAITAFHYIHQNPLKANMVQRLEDWQFSSFRDYADLRAGTLCNKKLAFELLNLNKESFFADSYFALEQEVVSKIYV